MDSRGAQALGYNGYSESQRNKITGALKRAYQADGTWNDSSPCGICLDPGRDARSWHSEDYSEPFILEPPATYPICFTCHGRLHKRFGQPLEWKLFLEHVMRGGYGRDFVAWHSKTQRDAYIRALAACATPDMPQGRPRHLTGSEWWLHLTLDPESLLAPWARPRPLRPYPDAAAYAAALAEARPSAQEQAFLRAHAGRPNRWGNMGELAALVLGHERAQPANMLYGKFAHRLADAVGEITDFQPDRRADGTSIWMSVIGEGWQPAERDFEWVMVSHLAAAVSELPA